MASKEPGAELGETGGDMNKQKRCHCPGPAYSEIGDEETSGDSKYIKGNSGLEKNHKAWGWAVG